jgi:O-methyltransferase
MANIRKYIPDKLKLIINVLRGKYGYNQDGLASRHNSDFMKDRHFMSCYNLAVKKNLHVDAKIHWRVHVACWAALHAKNLGGDFVECGVNKGFISRIIMEYINFKDVPSKFYLLDTFEGLDQKYVTSAEKKKGILDYNYKPCYEIVKDVFKDFKNVEIIKGRVPETLPLVKSKKIAYLYLDMNCLIPEIEALKYFWDSVMPGGIILFDDYGWALHIDQKLAFDKFAKGKGVEVLSLPTGQGMIVKP